ncbi:MAG: hypothetical protein AAGB51_09225 [Planctomycetota bacterium]
MSISASDLHPAGVGLPEDPGAALTEAWRRSHFAAQAAAEVGKSWGEPKDDDSHSSSAWDDAASALVWRTPRIACRLSLGDLTIDLAGDGGEREIPASGLRLSQLTDQVRNAATEIGGPPAQEALPAPDLPAHPLATGAMFESPSEADAALEAMYRFTGLLLDRAAGAMPGCEPVRCWPHHFDIAMLGVLARNGSGAMTRTVGLGLTPPDALSERGYWYVSPWSAAPLNAQSIAELPLGRWVERGGALPMAVLDVDICLAASDPAAAAADFLSNATNIMLGGLAQ